MRQRIVEGCDSCSIQPRTVGDLCIPCDRRSRMAPRIRELKVDRPAFKNCLSTILHGMTDSLPLSPSSTSTISQRMGVRQFTQTRKGVRGHSPSRCSCETRRLPVGSGRCDLKNCVPDTLKAGQATGDGKKFVLFTVLSAFATWGLRIRRYAASSHVGYAARSSPPSRLLRSGCSTITGGQL